MNSSFALQTKEEIIQKKFNNCCKKSLLSGIIKYNFKIINEKIVISLSSKLLSDYVLKYLKNLIKDIEIEEEKVKNNKYFSYNLNISNSNLLSILNIFDEHNNLLHNFELKTEHCKRAYIAGLFINSGSINPPSTTYYHLEITFKFKEAALFFLSLTEKYNFNFKQIVRNNKITCYIKKSSLISDFLKLMDASKSVLVFENERIERDFLNNINRLNNIDVYNYQKVLKAADEQIQIIQFLSKNNLINSLNSKMKILINLRLENIEANLEELANLMTKYYNIKISKSGVNHLFRNLKKIYLKYQK